MRNNSARSVALLASLLLLLLPLSAWAALTPVGTPFPIVDESSCSSIEELTVIARPEGDFEVVWVDDGQEQVWSRLFTPGLDPAGSPIALLPLHGGLRAFDLVGTWAGAYELAMNVVDFGTSPSAALAAYRVQIDEDGDPVAPPVRVKTPRFLELAPAAGGDSLQLRSEPPYFGPPQCQSLGLLARRIDENGAPVSAESRITRRAPAWNGIHLLVERLPNDTFLAAYSTCQNRNGLVVRRLNAAGMPLGKPINILPSSRLANVADHEVVLAANGRNFAVAVRVAFPNPAPPSPGPEDAYIGYITAVVNDKVLGSRFITVEAVQDVIDMAASPNGRYLVLYVGVGGEPLRRTLFVQELDLHGAPIGERLAVTGGDYLGVGGAVASLPDGRWLVVTRAQKGQVGEPTGCTERMIGTVLGSGS